MINELIGRLFPDGEAVSYCARCHCSVPLDEWEPCAGLTAFRHKGPLRFGGDPDRFCEPDDHGDDECGWVKPLPRKIAQ